MKILFDQGTPVPLREEMKDHEVLTAFEMGWSKVSNGELLTVAEGKAFALLITTDKNLRYQQNFGSRRIAILVLPTTRWPQIRLHVSEVLIAVKSIQPGDYRELNW